MKRWIKVSLGTLGVLVLAAGAAAIAGSMLATQRMQRKVDVKVQPVAAATDATSLERGKYLFASRGCVDCHGADGKGRMFIDTPDGLRVRGSNLTKGRNSAVAAYKPEDWVRAIRHGVAPGGRPLLVMPSEDYNRFTDADLAALVGYIQSLPPVDGEPALVDFPLPPRLAYGFGVLKDAAAKIDHTRPPERPVPEGVTVAHGAYVANMCLGCHGPALQGGRVPGGPPDWPPAPALVKGPDSAMNRYPDAQSFVRLFRTGKRPDGTPVRVMPFESLSAMSEVDIAALHLYLREGQQRGASR
jgi:mono/diheme cytochrome c family protein